MTNRKIYFDVDLTLTESNQHTLANTKVGYMIKMLDKLGYESYILTGKGVEYGWKIAKDNGIPIKGVAAENGGVVQSIEDSHPRIMGNSKPIIDKFKKKFTIPEDEGVDNDANEITINLKDENNKDIKVRFALEAKKAIITMFTESSLIVEGDDPQIKFNLNEDPKKFEKFARVHERFDLISSKSQKWILEKIKEIVENDSELRGRLLFLDHPDGAIDILALDENGVPYDKSRIEEIAKIMSKLGEWEKIDTIMVGDGANDIPALEKANRALTSSNSNSEAVRIVRKKIEELGPEHGCVTKSEMPKGDAILEGFLHFVRNGDFFHEEDHSIIEGVILYMMYEGKIPPREGINQYLEEKGIKPIPDRQLNLLKELHLFSPEGNYAGGNERLN